MAVSLALTASTPELPTRTVNGQKYYYYEVPKKETIYSITRKFGFTRDEILQHNPQVKDGLRAGDVLLFPVTDDVEVAVEQEEKAVAEVIAEEEIPVVETAGPVEASEEVAVAEAAEVAEVAEAAEAAEQIEDLNVAVMLPFMLDAPKMTRQAENNTQFYRGMLLALDELAPKSDFKVNLFAYDTAGSDSVLVSQLAQPQMAEMDFIIAPNDSVSIERISAMADSASAMVMNFFSVKNVSQKAHESLVQANIPREEMYGSAINAFCKEFASKKVIILNPTDLQADKKAFVDRLIPQLESAGIPYEQIKFTGTLNLHVLANLPKQDYVFLPVGASREILLRMLQTLTEYNTGIAGGSAVLFGYPEWVTIRGEIKEQLHQVNTVIYSRFSTALNCDKGKAVQAAYKEWYGEEIPKAVPNTVMLGYDAMAWLLFATVNGITEPFDGVQNAFRIQELEGAGDVNTALYFLMYSPGGEVDAKVL